MFPKGTLTYTTFDSKALYNIRLKHGLEMCFFLVGKLVECVLMLNEVVALISQVCLLVLYILQLISLWQHC